MLRTDPDTAEIYVRYINKSRESWCVKKTGAIKRMKVTIIGSTH